MADCYFKASTIKLGSTSASSNANENQDIIKSCTDNIYKDNKPYVGRKFKTLEEAETFYRNYGVANGFEIKIKTTHKHANTNTISARLFGCRRDRQNVARMLVDTDGQAKKRVRHRDVIVKTGCGAKMYVVHRVRTDDWEVTSFDVGHNHEMVSLTKTHFMQPERNMSAAAKCLLQTLDNSGVPPRQSYSVLGTYGGGIEYLGFDGQNIMNVLWDQRKSGVDTNDAHAGLELLHKLHMESYQKFFYKVKLDAEGILQCILWVDPRCLCAYHNFGDVVTFDTTYRTNRYSMPFVPISGVNHHYKTILFGFALMRDETEQTFEWVLRAWLEAVKSQQPTAITTYQDRAMGNAITEVLPQSKHLLCTWHISNKFPERLTNTYAKHPDTFKEDLNYCIYSSLIVEEFKESWKALLDRFQLHDHECLKSMYDIRHKWVRAFTRTVFTCGMTTTSRSEGMNSYFDLFVSPTTGIREFIEKSQRALVKQYMREKKSDYVTVNRVRSVELGTTLETHAADLYTKEIFRRFQVDQRRSVGLAVVIQPELCTFDMNVYDAYRPGTTKRRTIHYRIDSNSITGYITCYCKQFENSGTICRHLIRNLNQRQTADTKIPSNLISKRWLRDANRATAINSSMKVEIASL